MFDGNPLAVKFCDFEANLYTNCARTESFSVDGAAAFSDGGKWGRGWKSDGTTYLSDTVTLGGDSAFTLWVALESAETAIDERYAVLYFDSDDGLFRIYAYVVHTDYGNIMVIVVKDNVNMIYYESKYQEFNNTPVQFIINFTQDGCRILLNGYLVIDSDIVFNGISGTLRLGKDTDESPGLYAGIIYDQYRVFSGSLTPKQENAIAFDATAGDPFVQQSTVMPSQKSIFRQSSSIAPYDATIFAQSSYLFSKDSHTFAQSSTVSLGFTFKSVFKKSSSVETDTTGKANIIKRINS
jgi:hypothetical protein